MSEEQVMAMAEHEPARREAPSRAVHDAIVRTIKGLTIDAVEAAQSGHPGLPMGMADAATVLWTRFLRHDPARPDWPSRDRFVLSAGHGSMLLYSLLHLTGYALPLEALQRFRQLGSPTAGHPEHGHVPGVETTTGPLGQGFANGVGMALAERYLAARWNTREHAVIDSFIYAIVSDGDLMEGVASESASLAGHLGLGRLIYLYDDNKVTIDGPTSLAFTEDVGQRFEAYGWHVQAVDGHDPDAVAAALGRAQAALDKPSLIICRTIIGHGSPTWEGKHNIHSDPVGPDEVRRIKERIGLPVDRTFFIPDDVRAYFESERPGLAALTARWDATFAAFAAVEPARAAEWTAAWARAVPDLLERDLPSFEPSMPAAATRNVSGQVLQALAKRLPTLVGGSADLTPSNKTELKGGGLHARANPVGRNLAFGVREHAMGGVLNGMALFGAVRPYGGTFLTFSDYMRPAIRLAALMQQPVIYVFTHDSILLGEDGPTHQPVEHVMSLRMIPGLQVDRPADGKETVAAWLEAIARTDGPTALALTRQNVPHLAETSVEGARRGGYVVRDCAGAPDLLLLGTGSEVQLCLAAAATLAAEGVQVRVVSLPCWERFENQGEAYQDLVLPPAVRRRVAVEAGIGLGWERYVGPEGAIVAQDGFGASAPWKQLAEHFGFTAAHVTEVARTLLS